MTFAGRTELLVLLALRRLDDSGSSALPWSACEDQLAEASRAGIREVESR